MDEDKEQEIPTLWVVGFIGVAGLAIGYLQARSKTRTKLQKIEQWKLERLAVIENIKERMQKMVDDGCTLDEYMRAYSEEFKFLDQIVGPKPSKF